MQKKILSKTLKALLAVLMCFGVLQTRAFGVTKVLADDATEIAASKDITDEDGDGVYDLTLQVTGSAQSQSTTTVNKSNVVLVIDTSGSMDDDVAGGGTRMSHTKTAAINLVNTLLGNNKNEVKDGVSLMDIVEISLVTFAGASNTRTNGYLRTYDNNGAHYSGLADGADATSLKNTINGLNPVGGTNWEMALQRALTVAQGYASQTGESTSIIFLTDGKPTFRGSNDTGTGQEGNTNVQNCWNAASDDARSIITGGVTLYTIFAFGTDTGTNSGSNYLKALTNYAYRGSGTYSNYGTYTYSNGKSTTDYFFNANSTEALAAAFAAIIDSIQNNVGFGGVEVVDGVTTGVTNTSVTIGGSADPSKFTYHIKDGDTIKATVTINGNTATFKVGSQTVTATGESVTTTINGESVTTTVFTATVDGETYKMSPASINDDGRIDWNLSGVGIIGNGITYELVVEVWANQYAYDLVADLNNGIETLESAKTKYLAAGHTEEEWDKIESSLVNTGEGKYAIRTNYEQYVDYYTVEEEKDEDGNVISIKYTKQPRKDLGVKDPVPLTSSSMDLVKAWAAGLDTSELNEILYDDEGNSKEYKVKLHIWKADTLTELNSLISQYSEADASGSYTQADSHDYMDKTLGWDGSAYSWTDSLEVAPGTMINIDKAEEMGFDTSKLQQVTYDEVTYCILESGHYYYVTEENIDRHFELNTIIYHPMVVDGKLSNVTFDADGNVESIVPMSEVTATNTLKGGINILKRAYDDDAEILASKDIFTVKVTLKNPDGSPYTDFDYRIYYGENNPNYSDTTNYPKHRTGHIYGTENAVPADSERTTVTKDEPGEYERRILGNADGIVILKLYLGDTVRIVNVPAGVTYKVEETKVNDTELDAEGYAEGYKYSDITYQISKNSSSSYTDDVDEDEDGFYAVQGNSASQATVKNTVPSFDVVVLKTGTNENTEALAGVKFELYYDQECKEKVTKDSLGNELGELVSGADGKVALGTLVPGTYYLKETETVDGYKLLGTVVTITVPTTSDTETITITVKNEEITEYTVTKVWEDGAGVNRPETLTVQLYQVDGETKTAYGKAVELNAENKWTYTWTSLPKYDSTGNAIVYLAEETVPNGYLSTTEEGNGEITITNTEKTEATVKKVWADNNNQDNVQPTSLVVTLSNGQTVELNAANGWTATISNLPKYADGEEIVYTWTEANIPEYTLTGDVTSGTVTTLTNTHVPYTTKVTIVKSWNDNNDQDRLRDGVKGTITLIRTYGEEGSADKAELKLEVEATWTKDGNNWTAVVDKLPVYIDGQLVTYSVEETLTTPNGYELESVSAAVKAQKGENGAEGDSGTLTVTNKHTPATTDITVIKEWDDNSDQDGKRAAAGAKIQLYKTVGETKTAVGDPVTVGTDTDEWTYVFGRDEDGNTTLPVYEDGVAIEYSVEETKLTEDYTTEITDPVLSTDETREITVTNSYTPETTSIKVVKTWNDASDQDGKRSGVVASVQLYATPEGGTKKAVEGKTAPVPTGNSSNTLDVITFTGLPVYENGKKITYSVEETFTTANGYELESISAPVVAVNNETGVITVTNKNERTKTEATVKKIWDDNNNQDGKQPETLTVKLLADKEDTGKSVVLSADNNWADTITGLDKYRDHGTEIVYSWSEGTLPEGYQLTKTEKDPDDATITVITNSYKPQVTTISVTKVWADNKDQDGKRSGVEATIILYKTVGEDGTPEVVDSVKVGAQDNWSHTFGLDEEGNATLPVYEDGKPITYSVKEDLVTPNGYETDTAEPVNVENGSSKQITNTHVPEVTTITVTKVWDDSSDQDGKRSGVVATVTLYKTVNGVTTEVGTVNVEHEDGTVKEWTNLPVYEGGYAITYSVKETLSTPNEYVTDTAEAVTVANGGTKEIKNSYTPEKTKLTVTKTWDDSNDQDGKRADVKATVQLYKTVGETKTAVGEPVEVGVEENWSYVFGVDADGKPTLPVYENKIKIIYSVEEILPQGSEYTKRGDDVTKTAVKDDSGTIAITNSYTTKTVKVEVEKVWDDNNDQDGKRPLKVTVVLKADGETLRTIELNSEVEWKAVVENLPQFKDGKEIKYTFEELKISEYDTVVTDEATVIETGKEYKFTVTNTHKPETTKVVVVKKWVGDKEWLDDEKMNTRPEYIEVQLYKQIGENGEKSPVGEPVKLNEANEWTYTFGVDADGNTTLPVYENKQLITYTIGEVDVPDGYVSVTEGNAKNGFVITNTITPITFDPPVLKKIIGDKVDPTATFEFEMVAVTKDAPMPDGSADGKKTMTVPADEKAHEFGDVTLNKVGQYKYIIREVKGTDDHYKYDATEYELFFDVEVNTNNELVCQLTVTVGDTETIIPWKELKGFPFEFVNEYRDYIELEIVKVWDDGNDSQKLRPEEIEITVLANGEEIMTVILSEENEWTYVTEEPLPYSDENFKEITYSVVEKNVPKGYTVSYSKNEYKFTVTNTINPPETSDASGIGMWLTLFGVSVTNSLGLAYVSLKRKKEEQF